MRSKRSPHLWPRTSCRTHEEVHTDHPRSAAWLTPRENQQRALEWHGTLYLMGSTFKSICSLNYDQYCNSINEVTSLEITDDKSQK